MGQDTFVVVGAGLAGASAAAALRKRGFDGRIVLVGEEAERPYERPELSKKRLRGEPVDVFVHPADFYAEAGIELLAGRPVERLDAERRRVLLDGEAIAFDRLLLATGAAPRRLSVPGSELDGVVTLRTLADADRIRAASAAAASVVVVGGGWIGSEVAASLRQLGRTVTLVVPGEAPLEHVLGPEVAEVYAAAHRSNGVRIVTRARLDRIVGRDAVEAVVTTDGRTIPADLVVAGVGAAPRVELARDAGLAVDGGVLVDERLETSAPGIFAAGDVADAFHPGYGRRLRVEHWDNARRQGRAAAANMLGAGAAYERIPYFYSDQYDLGMEYTGFAPDPDEVVLRGQPDANAFVAFWLRQGRVLAGMNVNVWDVAGDVEALIVSGAPVDRRRLADPDVPLAEVAEAAA